MRRTELITQSMWDRAFADLAHVALPELPHTLDTPAAKRARQARPGPQEFSMYSRGRSLNVQETGLDDWGTPPWLFERLAEEFHFTLDVCANKQSALLPNFISPAQDGLTTSWFQRARGGDVFCNPPYDRTLKQWMRKAFFESPRITSVCLIPARTGQRFWWDFVVRGEVRFLKGHLKYLRGGVERGWAPFPSAVVIFGPRVQPSIKWWDARVEPLRRTG